MRPARVPLLLTILAVAATLVACSGTDPEARPGTESPDLGGPPTETAAPPPETDAFVETGAGEPGATVPEPPTPDGHDVADLRPPPIVLESEAGRQEAVQGSYCMTQTSPTGEGTGICTDTAFVHPAELSVIRPGEPLSIGVDGATRYPAGESFAVYPLGCGPERQVEAYVPPDEYPHFGSVVLVFAALSPGVYELAVFLRFETEDGVSGDTFGVVGLLVDPDREPAIIPVDESLAVCPYPEQP